MDLLGSEAGLRLLLYPLNSNIVTRTVCCSVGVGLPVYSTFKAIESKDQNEQQKWLVYWAAYGSFTVVEAFGDKFLSRVPFYYHMKCAFLVWLQFPTTLGAKQIYNNYLRPFFLQHQATVDQLLGFAHGHMAKVISTHEAEFLLARDAVVKISGSVYQTLRGGSGPKQLGRRNAIESSSSDQTETQDATETETQSITDSGSELDD